MIDNLSVAQSPSPPLQAANLVGVTLGQVPYHWAQLAGGGIQLVAGVGTAVALKVKTKGFLDGVSQRYFGPRGLKMSLKRDEDLIALLRLPEHTLALIDDDTEPLSIGQRRVNALRSFVAPLTFDVPPPS